MEKLGYKFQSQQNTVYYLWWQTPKQVNSTIKLDWLDKLKYLGCFLTATPVKLILVTV